MLPAGTELDLDQQKWTVVGPLPGCDPSGMGTPYIVTDQHGGEAVAKLVPKAPGAKRELLMGDSVKAAAYPNVMPVLDQGEHVDDWVIVMPRADMSLAAYVKQHGPIPVQDAVPILRDIATALAAIDGDIVHRDLKPQNVLLLNRSWHLADFGISKYAGASTAPDTHKYFLTEAYAAPEQWRLQTATSATDVYAFGGVAYELVSGSPPFPGPDFRDQHLRDRPARLTVGTPALRNLIQQCLMKARQARPTPAQILERLEDAAEEPPSSPGLKKLAEVNEQEIIRKAGEQQQASVQQDEEEERDLLHQSAVDLFEPIGQQLIEAIEAQASEAIVKMGEQGKLFIATLRGAQIGLDYAAPSPMPFTAGEFTVISESVITVTIPSTIGGYRGRSHSLWYCDAEDEGQFAWYEVGFMEWGLAIARPAIEPYHLAAFEAPPLAFRPGIGTTATLDWFDEIDLGDVSGFVDRWIGWFAEAAAGELRRHGPGPENVGTWRQQ